MSKKNSGKLLKKPRPTPGTLELLHLISMMPYAVAISCLVHAVLIAGAGVQCQDMNKWLCNAVVRGVLTCIISRQK
jgi:hypothetical protein